jgi:hypothetical protein
MRNQLPGSGVAFHQRPQVKAIDIFHREEIKRFLLVGVIDLDHVLVAPASHHAGLAHKPSGVGNILPVHVGDLDGNRTPQLAVPPIIDRGHPASPDQVLDAIIGQLPPDQRIIHRLFLISGHASPGHSLTNETVVNPTRY